MAWGLHPNPGGSKILCYACRAWWYKYPADSCGTCGATVPLRDGVCRACRHQAAFVAGRIKVPSAATGPGWTSRSQPQPGTRRFSLT